MWVHTRMGLREVLAAGITGICQTLCQVTTDKGDVITCTPGHPILTDAWVFKRACDLKDGDRVITSQYREFAPAIMAANQITIRKIEVKPTAVYNLKVDVDNEYIANGIVVHNCDAMVDGLMETMAKKLSIFDVLGTGQKSGWNRFMGR